MYYSCIHILFGLHTPRREQAADIADALKLGTLHHDRTGLAAHEHTLCYTV